MPPSPTFSPDGHEADNDSNPTEAPTEAPERVVPEHCKVLKEDISGACSYWAKVDKACEHKPDYMFTNC